MNPRLGVVAATGAAGPLTSPSAPALLDALTSHTPVGVFVSDPSGSCVFVNARWCELTGLEPEDAYGDGWSRALHPDDRERVALEWQAAAAEQRDSVVDYRFLRPDGTVAWVRGYAAAVSDERRGLLGWIGSCLEVTEYRTAMNELANERETFRAAFDDAPTGMALVSPEGRFLRANRAFSAIVGYSLEELQGLGFQDITHPDDLDADLELAQQLLRGVIPSYKLEKRYLRPNGSAYWALISVSLICDKLGQPVHFVVHVEDIHARRRNERRLRRQADEDSLTRLPNRRRLLEELRRESEQPAEAGRPPALLILLDMDNFKAVNDTLGHVAGDRVLTAVARTLQRSLPAGDFIARLGGDEFAVIARGANGSGPDAVGEELLRAVRATPFRDGDGRITLTATAGTTAITPGVAVTNLLEAADRALYSAKLAGGDRVER